MHRCTRIKHKLDVLKPHYLKIIDESHLHIGHIDYAVETHLRIKISAICLNDKTRLAQHFLINQILQDEFAHGLHALSIEVVN